MRRALLAGLLSCLIAASAQAQTLFDMTPERPAPPERQETAPGSAPSQPPSSPAEREPAPRPPGNLTPAQEGVRRDVYQRHILPEARLVFEGEIATRRWIVYLTERQAAVAARLQLTYQNAVVVAPELSSLDVRINGISVISAPIASADRPRQLDAQVPAGALRAGRNEIVIRAVQRHRTDCSIESTYELWTEIRSSGSMLVFAEPAAAEFSSLPDIRALAPDAEGVTHIDIVAPSLSRSDMGADLMRLSQALALQAGQADIRFRIMEGPAAPAAGASAPSLRVLIGERDDLAQAPGAGAVPSSDAFAGFVPAPDAVPQLVIAGSPAQQVAAIDRLASPVDRQPGTMRDSVTTEAWRAPNPPMVYGARRLSFSDMGLRSEQFGGRRYTARFSVAVPSDFYAGSYGNARIILDAAYTDAVRPGSLINVYVNGNVAASVPITTRRGAILDRFPIKVTTRHFLPGTNDIVLEVNMLTEQDAACLPGATASDTPRFAIFDTSQFELPDFARIAQRPDLSALSGTAFPYGLSTDPVPVMLERVDPVHLSAAAAILGRMAINASRVIPVEFTASVDAIRAKNAIFIGGASGMPAGVLSQVGVDADVARWRDPQAMPASDVNVDRWREEMGSRGIRGRLEAFQQWMSRTFNITLDMLRFVPGDDVIFRPGQDVAVLVSQGLNPERSGVWTMIATADRDGLPAGAERLARAPTWRAMGGHITTLGAGDATGVIPVTASEFQQTRPPDLGNYRLIAANWLSTNILSYSLILVLACILLGIATSVFLSRAGRRR